MHKEESDNKINEKNSPENNNMNPKVKLPKEKKIPKRIQQHPKNRKKKSIFQKKKNDKIEKTNIIQPNNAEQKNNIDEAQNTSSNLKENKEKRNWKSWSPQEKILFYEIIANGGNYSSLQKLFKTMNDVSIN